MNPNEINPGNHTQQTMSGSIGTRTEASLSSSMGLNRSPFAGPQDGPLEIEWGGSPANTKLLEISMSLEIKNKLEVALIGE